MSKIVSKKVRIPSAGILNALGGISGPINTPSFLGIKYIENLLVSGKEVIEVLPDGTEVKLDFKNFDKDNTKKIKVETKKEKNIYKDDVLEESGFVESSIEDVQEEVVEEQQEEDIKEEHQQNYNKQNNKNYNRKNKKYNNSNK